jgi:outer membrane protein TolC
MMVGLWCLMGLAPADTLRVPAAAALERAVAEAPAVAAATARSRAAAAAAREARRPRNPTLQVTAENLGAQRAVTGRDGLAGTEGQVTLNGVLPLGGDLAAAGRVADAVAEAAAVRGRIAALDAGGRFTDAVAQADLDRALADAARVEAEALRRLATALDARAAEGIGSRGEAARARIEAQAAAGAAARAAVLAASAGAELQRLLGTAADAVVLVEAPVCEASAATTMGAAPDADLLAAQRRAAEATVSLEGARAVPDLQPIAGWRRTAGFSGLLVGVGLDLPLFRSGAGPKAAARAEAEAVAADAVAEERRLAAAREAARSGLAALEAGATGFGPAWREDLARAVSSAEARHAAGEGTLAELLDARRARLLALGEYERWRAERRRLRAQLARLEGRAITDEVLCDDRS